MTTYRQCRCGAGPECLTISFVSYGRTGDIHLIQCNQCWHEVIAMRFGHYDGPLVAAWNAANAPQGLDAGIEGATCKTR